MRVSTCLGRRGSGVQIAPPRPIESVAYGHLGRPLKTAVDEFVAVVALKIHLLNTLGSAPVIPPQWRNDRGPSLKFNQESDPLCPRRGYGDFLPPHKSLRMNEPRRKHLQCANWPVDDFVAADFLKIQQSGKYRKVWSGRRDLNSGPLAPQHRDPSVGAQGQDNTSTISTTSVSDISSKSLVSG
jgi:hypothetical protein